MGQKKEAGDWRQRIHKMVSVGVVDDPINQGYDIVSTVALLLNLSISLAETFDNIVYRYGGILNAVEAVTVAFFAVDYVLRLLSAKYQYRQLSEGEAMRRYVLSVGGIVDLLSFLPFLLPVVFPRGAAAFRLLRLARILRLFRINSYYDSFAVIEEVVRSKRQQLLSSVYLIVILMLASSLAMYRLEHEAQPLVFRNAFSGIWWAASTLLTVGYGDIYPVTIAGKILGVCIAFLGVGMVAIPTGIISAGFVEQYEKVKTQGEIDAKNDLAINLKEIILTEDHPWTEMHIKNINISRQSTIVMVLRGRQTLIPRGDLLLEEGDRIFVYSSEFSDTEGA